MLIDPKVKKIVIFNAGGGIVEREIKLTLNQGINEFQIQNIPASFDPNSADIILEHISPEDKQFITLQQTITALPDMNNAQQIIDREKSAANSIISYAIDFTRELREKVSNICEASSYRTYADMKGTFNFIINCTKPEGEIIVKIIYFISDLRIRWHTSLQVNISKDGKSAEVEGFIIVDNKTGFSYENVELGFAIFELPRVSAYRGAESGAPGGGAAQEAAFPAALRQEMMGELNRLKDVQGKPMKRTQRMKNLNL
ncbi:MAG: hypothetical protein EU539_10125 [Promethearchaeota archaeon]|nr:MAG: hypothetical protein EU539_10125 [Candidatus Lokiarchaeota archaeon]